MWKWIGFVLLFLIFGLPLVSLLTEVEGGVGTVALVVAVGLFFYQRSQLAALRERIDRELAALRAQPYRRRDEREIQSDEQGAEKGARAAAAPIEPASADIETAAAPPSGTWVGAQDEVAAGVGRVATAEAASAAPAGVTQLLSEPGGAASVWPTPLEPASAAGALEVDERSVRVTSSVAQSVAAWFKGGNTIVRVAVLVLFVGVAFLLRYAVEQDLLPIELRLAAVAAGGVALLLIGWRLRHRRRGYAITLQGAGVGVLYMTLYAAMRLYGLLPPSATLAFMVAIAGLAALLALLQDALPMAVVGFLGGFAAPLLTAGDAGSHVMLFGYCLVLNLAIAWIASRKPWKLLNLVGLACTTLVALAWGAAAWRGDLLASTEPFLVAHLVLYLFITVQYARQLSATDESSAAVGAGNVPVPYVDAGLMFGAPLVAAGLQAAMVRHVPYALAASAAVLSGVYLLLGRWLWRRGGERLRLLTEGMLALGAIFLTLVAPLVLDARWTAAAWAVQGAGMVWVAMRQRRSWALYFGLALQPMAALSFWGRPLDTSASMFVANAVFAGVLLLAASALVCARLLQRGGWPESVNGQAATTAGFAPSPMMALHWAAIVLALLHLLVGGYVEMGRAPWSTPDRLQSSILWVVSVAVVLEAAHRPLAWSELALPARPLLAMAALLSLGGAAEAVIWSDGWARLWPAGLAEVAVVLLASGWLLRRLDAPSEAGARLRGSLPGEALGVLWYAMLQGLLFTVAVMVQFITDYRGWMGGALIVMPTLIAWLALSGVERGRWPMDRYPALWIIGLALPWMAILVLWSLAVNLLVDGSMQPLPYLPLLNPVDLGHGLMLLYALRLRRSLLALRADALTSRWPGAQTRVWAATAAVAFWWLTNVLVRTLHHWMGTPMWGDGALDSGLVQTGLSILWTLIALATMFVATRRFDTGHARSVWIVGAILLGVVVVKLLLVDLSQTSALQRIISFVGVGLLMLLVGYVAPLPPQRPPQGRVPNP